LFWKAAATNMSLGLFWLLGPLCGPLYTLGNILPILSARKLPFPTDEDRQPKLEEDALNAVYAIAPSVLEDVERDTGNVHESVAKYATLMGLRPAQMIHAFRMMADSELLPPPNVDMRTILKYLYRAE
jgi:hypothetical protein